MTKKANVTKRVVVISDLHCGHLVGLTPPGYQNMLQRGARARVAQVQRQLWATYAGMIDGLKPIDVLVCNGDAIDGRGSRSGGVELAFPDRNDQVGAAEEAILYAGAKNIVIVRGTPYHCGQEEDFEDQLARNVGASKVGAHEWVRVNGLVLDCKHHIGGSQIPHGRFTAVARDKMWSQIWAERGQQPKSDITIRSHVHTFGYVGGEGWLGMTTPALQGLGTRFGARRMSGTVDFGLVSFDITSRGQWSWQVHVERPPTQKTKVLDF